MRRTIPVCALVVLTMGLLLAGSSRLALATAPTSREARPAAPTRPAATSRPAAGQPDQPEAPARPAGELSEKSTEAEGVETETAAGSAAVGQPAAGQPAPPPGAPPAPAPVEGSPPPPDRPAGVAAGKEVPPVTPASHAAPLKPVLPPVTSTWGSVQLIGLLQSRFVMPLRGLSESYQTFKGSYAPGALSAGSEQNVAAEVQRIRIILKGHLITKNLSYLFQGDAVALPWLLDVKFNYKVPFVPGLSVTFGRFLPKFSLMMPTLISRLETAEYPILLTEGGYAPWRQLGLQVNYKLGLGPGVINAHLGVFNGPANGWTDDNHHKDIMVRADYTFKRGGAKGLMVGLNGWFGFPRCNYDAGDVAGSTCTEEDFIKNKADTEILAGVMARYLKNITPNSGLTAMAEFMLQHYTPWAENRDTWLGYGTWAHVGYRQKLGLLDVEGVARFDYLVPNQDQDDNYAWRVTAGANIFLQRIHSHFKINYFYQRNGDAYTGGRSWTDVKYGDDPTVLADWEVKQDLHMFLVQVNTEF